MPTSLSTEIGVALPTGWRQLRAKHLLREVIERSESSSIDELLTVSQYSGVTPTNADTERAGDISTYKRCRAGDLVVNTMLAWNGSLGVAPRDGVVSPAYSVYRFFDGTEPAFFSRMLRTPEYRRQIAMRSSGVVESRLRLYPTELYNLPLLVPSLQQQKAIVRFLEEKERDIEHYLATKRRMIEVLAHGMRSRLSAVITGTDDGPVHSTASSFHPRIGADWRLIPLRRLVWKVADGPHFSPDYVTAESGRPFISAGNVRPNGWNLNNLKYVSEHDFEEFSRRIVPSKGDVLYTKGGTTGVATFVNLDFPFQVWVHIAVLKVERNLIDPEYLAFALNGHGCYEQSQLYTKGATNQDLGLTRMVNIEVPVPPRTRQEALVRRMREIASSFETLRSSLEREIAVMEEYRTRLIADAVTGQIDVRGLA